jgi:NADH:ubiquinone oxidoreductase subunit D
MVLQDLTCAAGVDYDVRIAQPYSSYDDFDFIIPVGTSGDTYDRFCVRNAEVWQSISIIRQALEKCLKEMNFMLTFLTITSEEDVYTSMESLIYHFKIVMGEILFQLQKCTITEEIGVLFVVACDWGRTRIDFVQSLVFFVTIQYRT